MYLLFLIPIVIRLSSADIYYLEDADYERMPPPFHLDNYDRCMKKPDAVYCTLRMALYSNGSSELHDMMQEYSKYIGHFNYSSPMYGICASERCKNNISNEDGLQLCVNQMFYEKYELMASIVNFTCVTPDRVIEINTTDIFVAVLLSGILLLNVFGSLYDFYFTHEDNETGARWLLCFSISRNWRFLTATEDSQSDERLKVFKGLRTVKFLTSVIMIIGHCFLPCLMFMENPEFVENIYRTSVTQFISGGTILVQVFFIVSGLLLSYNLQLMKEKRAFDWTVAPKTVTLRWLRLLPPYGVWLAICCTWFKFIGFGPTSELIMIEHAHCNKYWWRHLLYINNLYSDSQYCLPHSWYLAADTQLFFIGVVVCVFFKTSIAIVLTILALVAFVIPPWIIYLKDLDSQFMASPRNMNDRLLLDPNYMNLHTATETNVFNYVVGLALGLIVYKLQQNNFDLRKYQKYRFVIWMLIPVGGAIMGSVSIFYMEQPRRSIYLRMLHGALSKPLFGITFATGLFLYIFNIDGTIRAVLEWPVWKMPSRLSYSAYIIHLTFVKLLINNIQVLSHASYVSLSEIMLYCIICSYVTAVPLWLLVEAPFIKLIKCFISTKNDNETRLKSD
ncbi:hypothetical protein K1T71_010504 [Dendrolimus kikuchii]|uniref:Uncharacterized protein n=1 Tax=Dendrolimus kikuchii TaxID=765133 RepID=A0ACC1CS31_9NEOP|nr:hypothetical protein K1T71_010504 [Dendrolimus kikuchii]